MKYLMTKLVQFVVYLLRPFFNLSKSSKEFWEGFIAFEDDKKWFGSYPLATFNVLSSYSKQTIYEKFVKRQFMAKSLKLNIPFLRQNGNEETRAKVLIERLNYLHKRMLFKENGIFVLKNIVRNIILFSNNDSIIRAAEIFGRDVIGMRGIDLNVDFSYNVNNACWVGTIVEIDNATVKQASTIERFDFALTLLPDEIFVGNIFDSKMNLLYSLFNRLNLSFGTLQSQIEMFNKFCNYARVVADRNNAHDTVLSNVSTFVCEGVFSKVGQRLVMDYKANVLCAAAAYIVYNTEVPEMPKVIQGLLQTEEDFIMFEALAEKMSIDYSWPQYEQYKLERTGQVVSNKPSHKTNAIQLVDDFENDNTPNKLPENSNTPTDLEEIPAVETEPSEEEEFDLNNFLNYLEKITSFGTGIPLIAEHEQTFFLHINQLYAGNEHINTELIERVYTVLNERENLDDFENAAWDTATEVLNDAVLWDAFASIIDEQHETRTQDAIMNVAGSTLSTIIFLAQFNSKKFYSSRNKLQTLVLFVVEQICSQLSDDEADVLFAEYALLQYVACCSELYKKSERSSPWRKVKSFVLSLIPLWFNQRMEYDKSGEMREYFVAESLRGLSHDKLKEMHKMQAATALILSRGLLNIVNFCDRFNDDEESALDGIRKLREGKTSKTHALNFGALSYNKLLQIDNAFEQTGSVKISTAFLILTTDEYMKTFMRNQKPDVLSRNGVMSVVA